MRLNRFPIIATFFLACLLFCGCSSSDEFGTIDGSVTLDGSPLAEGVVRFVPVDGASQTASAAIRDGRYTAQVPLGVKRIEFSAPKVIGKRKMYETADSPEVDVVDELLPDRYHVKSELQIDVQKGRNTQSHTLLTNE